MHRLEGFEEDLTPTTAKFKDNEGKETSVFDYFYKKYPNIFQSLRDHHNINIILDIIDIKSSWINKDICWW